MNNAPLLFVLGTLVIVFVSLWIAKKSPIVVPAPTDLIVDGNLTATWTANSSLTPYIFSTNPAVYMSTPVITNDGNNFTAPLSFSGDSGSTTIELIMVDLKGNYSKLESDEFVTCVLGDVELLTLNGIKKASELNEGDYFVQPFGPPLKITKCLVTEVHKPSMHAQLYAYKNTVVTYWHKILEEGKMVYPKDSKQFVNVNVEFPFTVYNFLLEDMEGLMKTSDGIFLETLKPYFDEQGIEHRPWM